MFSGTSWTQFLVYLIPILVVYAAGVLYFFYRSASKPTTASGALVGGTSSSSAAPVSLMGTPKDEGRRRHRQNGHGTCEACGQRLDQHSDDRVRTNSYGVPIEAAPVSEGEDNSTPGTAAAASSSSSSVPLSTEFDPVDGDIDPGDLISLVEKVTSVYRMADSGMSSESLRDEKADTVSLFANDDLLNSEVASQLALQLDTQVPTQDFSAVSALSELKAAA